MEQDRIQLPGSSEQQLALQNSHEQRGTRTETQFHKKELTKANLKYNLCQIGFRKWVRTSIKHADIDNCSSNSWIFYFFFFIVGSVEMLFSICLYLGIELISIEKSHKAEEVDYMIFGIALSVEALYLIFTKPVLIRQYYKSYRGKTCSAFIVSIFHAIIGLLPCEMVIFFGYDGRHDYDQALLNYSWLRRIISTIRICIQMIAVTNLLAGGFVTLVCVCQTLYLTVLLVSICPQSSTYDAQSWYRRA